MEELGAAARGVWSIVSGNELHRLAQDSEKTIERPQLLVRQKSLIPEWRGGGGGRGWV